ncbi:hypothetical protein MNBD_ALPHA09-952 [hydrothermal vent metagenome]|uniref:Uncharacterized protein n=1 Tax=hydrothermal vent metagenome TaxID=652676 RepID=A0A3B0TC73_9ZZZZ
MNALPHEEEDAAADQLAKANSLLASGKIKAAERLLQTIVGNDPANASAQARLAALALDRGTLDIARKALATALRHAPDMPDLHHLLGRLLDAQGRANEAIGAFASAISLKPDHEATHRSLAPLLFRHKRYEEARKSAAIALVLAPDDVSLLLLLADIEHACKQPQAVLPHLTKAIQLDRGNPAVTRRLCETLLDLGKLKEAVIWGNQAWKLDPTAPQAALSYGLALDAIKHYDEVINVLALALSRCQMSKPQTAFAENLIARALTHLGRRDEAVRHARRAIENADNNASYASTYCRALNNVGRLDDAVAFAKDLKKRLPNHPGAAIVLAYALRECGEYRLSEDIYTSVINSPNKRAEAEFGIAMIQLIEGRYEDGFKNYEARLEPPVEVINPKPPLPMWDGNPDPEVRLVVLREQGMGDEFQFCRFLAAARARVGHLNYVTYPSMVRILAPALKDIEVSADSMTGRKSEGHKWRWLPLMSLPHALGLNGAEFAAATPYLAAEPEAVKKMSKQIKTGRFKVGITWQGSPTSQVERGRSLPLAAFAPFAELDGVHFYSLQKNHGLDQLRTVPFADRITDFGESFDAGDNAFIDTAGAMMNLDLIITSDTSIAHLAGALGRPCYVILQHQAEWRWGVEGDRSIWYPSLRLARQTAPGDWKSAIVPAAKAIKDLVPPPVLETAPAMTAPPI